MANTTHRAGILAGVKAPEPGDPAFPLTDEQDAAIKILHAALVHVRESGRTPSKTVLERLREFSKGSKPTRSRGDRERRMMQALAHAVMAGAPLTGPGRKRARATGTTAFESATASLKKHGINTTPIALRNVYESAWGRARVRDLLSAWRRYTARTK
jgi:hypothetical protein